MDSPKKLVKSVVYVRTEFAALHRWPEAPSNVAFLRNLHRHLFKVELRINVTHSDRDEEFFTVKRQLDMAVDSLKSMLSTEGCESMSCEHMCEFLYNHLKELVNIASVDVSEDGENGATLYYA